jgi:YVTN family beta-propeller protein
MTRDGTKLFVANGKSSTVTIIDTKTNTVANEVPVGATPWGVFLR